jgi:hypothetical protein
MDVNYPRLVLAGLLIAVVLGVGVAASTSGAAFGAYNAEWDGASDLRAIGTDAGADVEIVRNVTAYRDHEANETVAVILSPDRDYTQEEREQLGTFVREGGTLLVAEDFGTRGNDLLAGVGASARFDGGLLRDEREYYRAPALPEATNVSEQPLTDGVGSLALNYGTPVQPGEATVLVSTSEFGYVDRNRNGELDDAETLGSYPVATVESVGEGRVIAVGDPSLLINAMVERPGNRAFATNVLGSRETVLLDYSHTADIPPLSLLLLVLREEPLLQVLVGALGIGTVALWVRGDVARLRERGARAVVRLRGRPTASRARNQKRADEPVDPGLSEAELRDYLAERHPEWDDERVERVIRGVLYTETEPEER